MHQVKLFKGLESDYERLEREINAWIRETGARIISVTGNIAPQTKQSENKTGALGPSIYPPSDLLLIVLYETQG